MEPRNVTISVMRQADITGAEASWIAMPRISGNMGPGLLERIVELGSMQDAARALGLDEDLAWDYLVAANNLSDFPLIRSMNTNLTPTRQGQHLLGRTEDMTRAFQNFLDAPRGGAFKQFQLRHQFLRRLEARTSARNQFYCRIRSVRRERVNAVVMLDLGGGDQLAAQITTRSAEDLGLVGGGTCHALIDPGWIEVRPDTVPERGQQHNALCGRVVRCHDDPVDAEVAIELAGGRIVVASMTRAEIEEKGIRSGRRALALVQSSQIILAVEAPASAATHPSGDKA